MQFIERADGNISSPSTSDLDDGRNHLTSDPSDNIIKEKTIYQKHELRKTDLLNIFMIVNDALFKRYLKIKGRPYCNKPASIPLILSKTLEGCILRKVCQI